MNPYVLARFNSGLSLQQLGQQLKLSKQYICRIEAGNDSEVNTRLVTFAAQTLDVDAMGVVSAYENFQRSKRASTISELKVAPLVNRYTTFAQTLQPGFITFGLWRRVYWESVHEFAKQMCVRAETVKPYEDGQREEMPYSLREVLEECHLLNDEWTG